MRIALMSDIHGNPIALDAVLRDVKASGGADEIWVLGDLCAIGYDPASVIKRLRSLSNARFVRGNTDRYVTSGEQPIPIKYLEENPGIAQRYIQGVASFAWTRGVLSATSDLDWLASLPLEMRLDLADGTRLLCVHAAPGTDDGDGIHHGLAEDELENILRDAGAELVMVGHTHVPLDKQTKQVRVVNLGSVSNPLVNPLTPDLRASYVVVDADDSGYRLEHRLVDYDRKAVITAIAKSGHPSPDYLTSFMAGEMKAPFLPESAT